MSEFPVQVTIKPPAQYASAPWLNFQAQDKEELETQLREAFPTVEADSLSELVAKAYLEYGAVLTAMVGLIAPLPAPAAPVAAPNAAPQAQARPDFVSATAPALAPPAPQCVHGEKVYRTGTGAKGPWRAWFCSAPKGDPTQCKAVFL